MLIPEGNIEGFEEFISDFLNVCNVCFAKEIFGTVKVEKGVLYITVDSLDEKSESVLRELFGDTCEILKTRSKSLRLKKKNSYLTLWDFKSLKDLEKHLENQNDST